MNVRDTIYAARRLWRVGASDPGAPIPGYGFYRAIGGGVHNPTRARATAMVCQVDQRAIALLGARPVEWVKSVPRQMLEHATCPQYEVVGRERVPIPLSHERRRAAMRALARQLFQRRAPLFPVH